MNSRKKGRIKRNQKRSLPSGFSFNVKSDVVLQIIQAGIQAVRPSFLLPRLLAQPRWPELREWLVSHRNYLLCIGKASVDSAESILSEISAAGSFIIAPEGT